MVVFKQRVSRLAKGATLAMALAPLPAAAQTSPDRMEAMEQRIHQLEDEVRMLQRALGARQQLRQSRRETVQAPARATQTARAAGQPQPPALAATPAALSPAAPATQPPPAAATRPAMASPGSPEIIVGVPPAAAAPLPGAGVHVLEAGPARFGIESADGRNAIFLTGRLHFDIGDYLDYHPGSKFAAVQDLNSGVNARRARLGVIGRFMHDWDFNFIFDFGGSTDGYPPLTGALPSGIENALLT